MIDFVNICGWLGTLCFSVYTIPQAIDTYKQGKTTNLSSGMALLLFGGALCSFIYIIPDVRSPLFYNFLISIVSSGTILKYHFLPRKSRN
ncbi:MAG: PQ-loop repeat-containing protein [Alphaproteobacteria bacterium]|nr:PQ-loop repeat-containing protein [Alphaproteobacteria bacterium]